MKEIKRKTLLYRSGVEGAGYCINHIEGCSHGCKFPCYAMIMKKRCGKIKDYNDWIRPKLVGNALELLNKELPRLKDRIKVVHLCFTTDPFMYKQPDVISLTLKIIERLNQENIKCIVLTKGVYPEQLIDIQRYEENNEYGITLISIDEDFKKRMEPYAASYAERIKSLKFLHKKGFKTWVSMEPYPTPNLVEQNLSEILEKINFVDKIIFGKLNYNFQSAQFPGNRDFYQKHADMVKSFCEDSRIECHIRYGTSERDDRKIGDTLKKEDKIRKLGGILPVPI
ncbi:radical SAM protein [Patescibacteria group bacterium]|nr:radical SAM protein [Patescibacteria group bacterium]